MYLSRFCTVVFCLLAAACMTAPKGGPVATDPAYREPHRPRFHFSPPAMWMNDPNGMVYYAGNPVRPNPGGLRDFRDPRVFWHAATRRWIMALSATDHVRFWASENLKQWEYLSDFGRNRGAHGGVWECPDLFPLQVDGETRWVLLLNLNPGGPQGGSGTQYFVGDFDGRRFTLDDAFADTLRRQEAVWLDWGRDNYAGVTWSDIPPSDGRRLFIGWMGNWDYAQKVPTQPWRSAMTLPRSLHLAKTGVEYRVHSRPVRELERLRIDTVALPAMVVNGTVSLAEHVDLPLSTVELTLVFEDPGSAGMGLRLTNGVGEEYRIGDDGSRGEFYSDRRLAGDSGFSPDFAARVHRAPRAGKAGALSLTLYIDVASVELFADGGATVMTETFFPSQPSIGLIFTGPARSSCPAKSAL